MMYKFYILKGELNDATSFYVNMIKEAIERMGNPVTFVSKLRDIDRHDKVLTITSKAFFMVWLKNPNQYIINWWQGIAPEEISLMFNNRLSKTPRIIIYRLFEKITLLFSKKNLFVSHAMKDHYRKKYNYNKTNYLIIPCFNQEIDPNAFVNEKYLTPTFVYAGSMSQWQCVDQMLMLYRLIKESIKNSQLIILTKETDIATRKCEQYNVDACIYSVPLSDLNNTLKQFKYGFIVRDDIAVNNVATPTKMNSYMASGVIPVYSDVIYDYQDVLSNSKYTVPFLCNKECVNKIIELESKTLIKEDILLEYKKIFAKYWSKEHYIKQIVQFLH